MIPEDRPTAMPVAIAWLLSRIYACGIGAQNFRYGRGLGVTKLPVPVVSVGNLSAGGTGKTPIVQHIVRTLIESGHRPMIAMRGYGAAQGAQSDEELEHLASFPGLPIVAQPDRITGILAALKSGADSDSDSGSPIDSIVLDDGFQHRKIARDLDIVAIDATKPPDRDALLPLGYLREGTRSLARAQLAVITRSEQVEPAEIERIGELVRSSSSGRCAVCVARSEWSSVTRWASPGSSEPGSVEDLGSGPVLLVSAIGNPGAFETMVRRSGVEVAAHQRFKDHDTYDAQGVRRIVERARASGVSRVLTTRKDWVKLRESADLFGSVEGLVVLVPEISIEIERGSDALDRALGGIF